MFSNYLAIVTGRPEAPGTTQTDDTQEISAEGTESVQGFLPILMQMLPNPLPGTVPTEVNIGDPGAVSADAEENTTVIAVIQSDMNGRPKGDPGITRFSVLSLFERVGNQTQFQEQTEATDIGPGTSANAPRPGTFSATQTEIPVATEDPSAAPERIPESSRPVPLSGSSVESDRVSTDQVKYETQSVENIARQGNPVTAAAPPSPAKPDTQVNPAPMHDANIRDTTVKPKEPASVHTEPTGVRSGVAPQEIQIPQSPPGSTQDESGQSRDRTRDDSFAATQPGAGEKAKSESLKPGIDKAPGSLSSPLNGQDGTTAPIPASTTKGESVHTPSPHSVSHTVQMGTADVVATSPSIEQQIPLPPDIARSVINQVARELAQRIGDQGSEIRLMLKPETLGELALKVKLQDGTMTAQIDVTQAGVKAALESHLPDLRMALQSKGIEVRSIDIFTQSEMASNAGGQTPSRSHSQTRRRYALESSDRYQSSRQLGYNTIEIII